MNVDVKVASKVELEYTVNSSANIVFQRLCTPHGLSEWFADDVNIKENLYTFIWDKTEQTARMLQMKDNKTIRFQWVDDLDQKPQDGEEDDYFEFKITVMELTGETVLTITDSIVPEEKEDTIELWNEQIERLKTKLGSV